jgi:tyrosyl-tRNA synthetase
MTDQTLIQDLGWRGMIQQMTAEDELKEHLSEGMKVVYCGFDPTADSLHIGSLVPLLALKRFQQYGHKPIALVGGSTGLIGDPSFKAAERQLNTEDVVGDWVECLKKQVSQFIDFDCGENSAVVANNLDWTKGVDVLSFLRDVGKHFSINAMIQKESVKQRLDREGSGISFTEFSYMILQSYDFAELNKRYSCTVQIGGSDQWGNITGGIDLTRRMNQQKVFGLTLPLVTKSDGTKFGKTESGTIWLDAKKTSQYAFYQFWLNTADADVYKFLRYFTFLDESVILQIEKDDAEAQGRPAAQGILAKEVTKLVHGDEGLAGAIRITEALFSGGIDTLSEDDLEQLKLDGLPSSTLYRKELTNEKPLTTLLVDSGVATNGKQVKDALGKNAVLFNGQAKSMQDNMDVIGCFNLEFALYKRFYICKLGKKKYHLFEIINT